MSFKGFSVLSSGSHFVLAECNPLANFGRGLFEEDLHEIEPVHETSNNVVWATSNAFASHLSIL